MQPDFHTLCQYRLECAKEDSEKQLVQAREFIDTVEEYIQKKLIEMRNE